MDEDLQQPDSAEEVQAAADAQAGYERRARAGSSEPAPAASVPAVQPAAASQPLADSVPPSASAEEADPEPAPDLQAEPAAPSAQALASTLEDVRAQLKELRERGADAATVRKMHGEIGELNRTIQQIKALQKAEAPADDEFAAALVSAEKVAEEYPDIAGPLVKALKVLQARAQTPAPAAVEPVTPDLQQQEPTQANAQPGAEDLRVVAAQEAAIKALDEVHPDRFKVKETPEFKSWFAAKTPEYQTKVNTSWNPAVVAQCFTDFKASLAARKSKQNRAEAAVQPTGVPQSSQPTVLPDEAGIERGYKRRAAQRL
jgi:hypothetical protein